MSSPEGGSRASACVAANGAADPSLRYINVTSTGGGSKGGGGAAVPRLTDRTFVASSTAKGSSLVFYDKAGKQTSTIALPSVDPVLQLVSGELDCVKSAFVVALLKDSGFGVSTR